MTTEYHFSICLCDICREGIPSGDPIVTMKTLHMHPKCAVKFKNSIGMVCLALEDIGICSDCGRNIATEDDWEKTPEGEGDHLCFGSNCDRS
jgi:hypothetical protein